MVLWRNYWKWSFQYPLYPQKHYAIIPHCCDLEISNTFRSGNCVVHCDRELLLKITLENWPTALLLSGFLKRKLLKPMIDDIPRDVEVISRRLSDVVWQRNWSLSHNLVRHRSWSATTHRTPRIKHFLWHPNGPNRNCGIWKFGASTNRHSSDFPRRKWKGFRIPKS